MDQAEERICEIKTSLKLFNQRITKQKEYKIVKKAYGKLWNTIKRSNLQTIGVPEGKQKEKGAERLFKVIIAVNFPNLRRNLAIQVHEAHRSPNNLNLKRSSPRYITIKLSKMKDKERNLKATGEMFITYKRTSPPLTRLS